MNSECSTYRNGLDRFTLAMGLIVFLVALAYSLLILGGWKAVVVCSLLGGLFLLAAVYGTLRHTPKVVRIENGEVIMYSFLGTVRKARLEKIKCLRINPPNPPQRWKRFLVGGDVWFENGKMIYVSREIGGAIKEAYFEEFGHYPPEPRKPNQMYNKIGLNSH